MRLRAAGVLVSMLLSLFTPGDCRADNVPTFYFLHHRISTSNVQAQQLFDEGLTYVYAYNREAAEAEFSAAAVADPKLAIAWWGVALAHGPNINIKMTLDDMLSAIQAIAKAKSLEGGASAEERSLIDAIGSRYNEHSKQTQLAGPYAQAMRKVATAYPDDPDVQALYVESMLDALTFKSPMRGMPDESAMQKQAADDLQRWPDNIGLLHFYIHLTEPNTSAIAVQVADRLAAFSFAPQASHLTHMPSHVYMYVGAWAKMRSLNQKAVNMDLEQAKSSAVAPIHLDYFIHNLSFWYGSAVMSGNELSAASAADVWSSYNAEIKWIEAAQFGHADEAARLIESSGVKKDLANVPFRVLYFYGLACAETGKIAEAQRAVDIIQRRFHPSDVRTLGVSIVKGRIAEASDDFATARTLYTSAAGVQDKMQFEDAPPWSYAPRDLLAAMELRSGDPSTAISVAQTGLRKHPGSVPMLTILESAYAALGRSDDVARIKGEIDSARQ